MWTRRASPRHPRPSRYDEGDSEAVSDATTAKAEVQKGSGEIAKALEQVREAIEKVRQQTEEAVKKNRENRRQDTQPLER